MVVALRPAGIHVHALPHSNALRELVLKEIWRLLDGEPGISGALDNRVQVTCRILPSGTPLRNSRAPS